MRNGPELKLETPGGATGTPINRRLLTGVMITALILGLLWMVAALWRLFAVLEMLGSSLRHAPVRDSAGRLTDWGSLFGATAPVPMALRCAFQHACQPWFLLEFGRHFSASRLLSPAVGLLLLSAVIRRTLPAISMRKDPGQARWASRTDPDISLLLVSDPKDLRNMLSLYLGHWLPWKTAVSDFDWRNPELIRLRERDRCENVLVVGAPGSGKTRGWFRPNVMMDALMGNTAVVFDFKYPQAGSGFLDLIAFWKAKGRRVLIFTPFDPGSPSIPLLANIDDMNEALKLARGIIAPPEFEKEVGGNYKDNERRIFAGMILAIANGPAPTMNEVRRLGQNNVAQIVAWYKRQRDPRVRDALKAMFDKRQDQIADIQGGIMNKLQVFHNEHVSKATSFQPGNEIDLESMFFEPTLLYIGIPQSEMMEGGELLVRLIKRRIDRALLNVAQVSPGGELPILTQIYMDEFTVPGALPFMMNTLSTYRSRRASIAIGVQNLEQSGLAYGKTYSSAMLSNNIGYVVNFLRGSSYEEARRTSDVLGFMTVPEATEGRSSKIMGLPFGEDQRRQQSTRLVKRELLTHEQINRTGKYLAVIHAKGQNPLLAATPPLEDAQLPIRDWKGTTYTIENALHKEWTKVARGRKMERESLDIIARARTASTRSPAKFMATAVEMFLDWMTILMTEGADVVSHTRKDNLWIEVRVSSLPAGCRNDQVTSYLNEQGWLLTPDDPEQLIVTTEGLSLLSPDLRRRLRHADAVLRALAWVREHRSEVEGIAVTPPQRLEGVYTRETLTIPIDTARQLYGVLPDLPTTRRGTLMMVTLPLHDAAALNAAIHRAQQAEESRMGVHPEDKPLKSHKPGRKVAVERPEKREQAESGDFISEGHGLPNNTVQPNAVLQNLDDEAQPTLPQAKRRGRPKKIVDPVQQADPNRNSQHEAADDFLPGRERALPEEFQISPPRWFDQGDADES